MLVNLKNNAMLKLFKIYLLNYKNCKIINAIFDKLYKQSKMHFVT